MKFKLVIMAVWHSSELLIFRFLVEGKELLVPEDGKKQRNNTDDHT